MSLALKTALTEMKILSTILLILPISCLGEELICISDAYKVFTGSGATVDAGRNLTLVVDNIFGFREFDESDYSGTCVTEGAINMVCTSKERNPGFPQFPIAHTLYIDKISLHFNYASQFQSGMSIAVGECAEQKFRD